MKISEQDKSRTIRLIGEEECLEPYDLEAFYRWMEASCEALKFDPVQQERFVRYCGSSCDSTSARLHMGLWMLKQAF